MKQALQPSEPVQQFPSVLSKIQSGSLFTKSNLFSSLFKLQTENPTTLSQSLSSPKCFKQFLLKFYKNFSFDPNKSHEASSKIEYLLSLYKIVSNRGGWSTITGRDYWKLICKKLDFEDPNKTREDYENFLFELEKNSNELVSGSVLMKMVPGLMKNAEFFRTGAEDSELGNEILQSLLRKNLVVVPGMVNLMLGIDIERFLRSKEICEISETGEFPLLDFQGIYEEIDGKVVCGVHWYGKSNLLQYSSCPTPTLVKIKTRAHYFSTLSDLQANRILFCLSGQTEIFIITEKNLQSLSNKPKKSQNCLFDNTWQPDEQFLLSQQIEFTFIKTIPGDTVFIQSQAHFWLVSNDSVIVHWLLLPIFRIKEVSSAYLSSIASPHSFNLPLIAVEYLNTNLISTEPAIVEVLKEVINESIEDECWTGSYEEEDFDYRVCVECKKDLFWRYAVCKTCVEQGLQSGFCLRCVKEHKCAKVIRVEKFSSVDLDTFYCRLGGIDMEKSQKSLKKVKEVNFVEKKYLKIDYKAVEEYEDKFEYLVKEEVILESSQQSEDSYKRVGNKKQKIGEGNEKKNVFNNEEGFLDEEGSIKKKSSRKKR